MDEYIKRDDMRAVLEKASISPRFADEPPAADVEPVVHAHWKNSNPKCPFSAYCSNCRANALCDYLGDEILSDRCPNCGAKMDGEA